LSTHIDFVLRGIELVRWKWDQVTITLELPSELEARLLAEAKAKGVSIEAVVKEYLWHATPTANLARLSAEEVDEELDAAADLIPQNIPPLSSEAMSRENIYTREDDWQP
jgi:hypothetical protein